TAELLLAYKDRLRVVVGTERRGKTHGMNRLVAQSTQPILVFTDANVMIETTALERIRAHFRDPQVGCVASHLRYVNSDESVTASVGSTYWRLEEWIKKLETRTGSAMGADGSLFAIRRELHQAPPDDIIDDMFVSFAVLCAGYRVVQADDVNAFEKSVSSGSEEFSRKVRIACQAFNVHRVIWPNIRQQSALDVYKYLSHKWLRWFAIYLLAAGGLLFLLGLALAGQSSVAIALLLLGALGLYAGHRGWAGPFATLWDVLLAFAGTGLGVYRSLQGARFQTWAPAASIRK
ncbi:MAG: histidine kinase, partial [Myxococcaceae bacterium]|nr:histidine kinase [Myxococcaceae bacterium]